MSKNNIKENKTIQNNKDTSIKSKIKMSLVIIIIIIEIITLIMVVKREKEPKEPNNYFIVKTINTPYAESSSAYPGLPIKFECNDTIKIDITLDGGSLFNNSKTLSALGENKYTTTCENKETIYWTPDSTIEENEIITIYFETDNKKIKTKEIKIKKQNYKYKVIELT